MRRRVPASERCPRRHDDHRHLCRCVLLPRRHGRSAPPPSHAPPPPRPPQGRQPGTRPGGARTAASHARASQRAQAGLRVAARHARQRHHVPAHRTRGAAGGAVRLTMLHALDVCVVLLVLPLAVRTIAARETFAAVVSFMAYGLLLTLAWMRLAAPAVALAVAAIGSGLSGVLLLGAAAGLRATERPAAAERPGALRRLAAGILSATIAAGLAVGVLSLPDPGPTLAPSVAEHLPTTGVGKPVTGVLMAFRAMDTMLEKIVLLFALVGVWSLAPDRLWGGRPGPRHQADPRGVLAFLARLLPPVGFVIGVYLLWVSADDPGGAFQGSTILAAMWLLVMMAGLGDTPPVASRWLRLALIRSEERRVGTGGGRAGGRCA